MSSLAATQADGYYVPPDYYNSGQYKKKTRNQFQQQQTNDSSRRRFGHNQFLQNGVVRFELPYKGFCEGCHRAIGKGTRFNATKLPAGHYHTTRIWEFRMACRHPDCSQQFTLRTQPAQQTFEYVKGITKNSIDEAHSRSTTNEDRDATTTSTLCVTNLDLEEQDSNPLSRLESVSRGERAARTEREELERVYQHRHQSQGEGRDVQHNARLRKRFRKEKQEQQQQTTTTAAAAAAAELTVEDVLQSKTVVYQNGKREEMTRFRALRTGSIFGTPRKKKRRSSSHGRDSSRIKADPDFVPSVSSEHADAIVIKEEGVPARPPSGQKQKKKILWVSPSQTLLVADRIPETSKPVKELQPRTPQHRGSNSGGSSVALSSLLADYSSSSSSSSDGGEEEEEER